MRTIEEYIEMTKYLTIEEVEQPKLTIEKMVNISRDLTEDNYFTYVLFIALRPDLSEEEVTYYTNLSRIKIALEERDVKEQYKHFEVATY